MSNNPLEAANAESRYANELKQGASIANSEIEGEAWGWRTPAGTLRANRRGKFLIESAQLAPGKTCLEVGCGTGEFTQRLVKSGCKLTAVEISPDLANVCRKACPDAEVIVGNIETGDGFQDRKFDAIVAVSVLHHVNMDLFFKNTMSKLKPGGRFAFSEPNMRNPQIWAERNVGWVRRWRHVTPHETAFKTGPLRKMFESHGFTVELCRPFDFMHPGTPRFMIGLVGGLQTVLEAFPPTRLIAGSIQIAGRRPE
jgi:2-polyprenyl-3-methyl-5-hydroxy-6-metoxy-1,4-benzoquinol methylase